jgi:hypothetical protein
MNSGAMTVIKTDGIRFALVNDEEIKTFAIYGISY